MISAPIWIPALVCGLYAATSWSMTLDEDFGDHGVYEVPVEDGAYEESTVGGGIIDGALLLFTGQKLTSGPYLRYRLQKITPKGDVDKTFSPSPELDATPPHDGSAYELAVEIEQGPNGHILFARNGRASFGDVQYRSTMSLCVLLPDGKIDPAVSGGSCRTIFDEPYYLTTHLPKPIGDDDKVSLSTVTGLYGQGGIGFFRYHLDGEMAPDSEFGNGGAATINGPSPTFATGTSSMTTPDRGYVFAQVNLDEPVAGHSQLKITKLDKNGHRDLGFGTEGVFTHDLGRSQIYFPSLTMDPAGNLFILLEETAPTLPDAPESSLNLLKIKPSGKLDESFGLLGEARKKVCACSFQAGAAGIGFDDSGITLFATILKDDGFTGSATFSLNEKGDWAKFEPSDQAELLTGVFMDRRGSSIVYTTSMAFDGGVHVRVRRYKKDAKMPVLGDRAYSASSPRSSHP